MSNCKNYHTDGSYVLDQKNYIKDVSNCYHGKASFQFTPVPIDYVYTK